MLVPPHRALWWRLGVLVALIVGGAVLALLIDLPRSDEVRRRIDDTGALAPIVFVIGYALATLAPVPKNVLSVVGGAVFGLATATGLVVSGATLGAAAAFWIGRVLGREAVEQLTGGRVERLNALLVRRGLVSVIVVRLVPVVPFTVINYGAGLTRVRWRDYILGTIVGILPGSVSYVVVGAYGTDPTSTPFLGAAAVLVGLSALGLTVLRRRRRTGLAASGSRNADA